MKKIRLSLLTISLVILSFSFSPVKLTAQVVVNFQFFYDNLAPYGNWVNYPGHGFVWAPAVSNGFRPYVSGGHWAYSDMGWMWVSNYNWGWAPFHYGSWLHDPYYGWLWVPGYNWAPAWVTWGSYNGYYGWAPVAPGFSMSVEYYPPVSHWCFMEPRYMVMSNWGNNYYVAQNNQIVINNTTIITNERRISSVSNTSNYGGRAYYAGPRREEVARASHADVRPVSLRESGSPGRMKVSDNSISVYRPRISSESRTAAKPAKVIPMENLRASQGAERTGSHQLQKSNELTQAGQRNAEKAHTPTNERRSVNQNVQAPSGKAEMTKPALEGRNATEQRQPGKVNPQREQRTAPEREPRQMAPAEISRPQREAVPAERQQQPRMSSPSAERQQQSSHQLNGNERRTAMQPQQQTPREQAPRQQQQREQPRQQMHPGPGQQAPAPHKGEGRPK